MTQPVLFVGHGTPMNAASDNAWSRGFRDLAADLAKPAAVVAISAHWYTDGTFLTDNAAPKTIHDFSGFPDHLYEIQYPAPGHPDLAAQVVARLESAPAALRSDWGLDHGTWSVLRWMFPDADVPVIQLSIDRRATPARHLELARSLADLRHQNVLVIGSGNITHNLRDAFARMNASNAETPAWSRDFDARVESAVAERDAKALLALSEGDLAKQAHPSPDHWLPLLYAFGASGDSDDARFPITGFDLGSISMRSVRFG